MIAAQLRARHPLFIVRQTRSGVAGNSRIGLPMAS
jgi:hypothetical protein